MGELEAMCVCVCVCVCVCWPPSVPISIGTAGSFMICFPNYVLVRTTPPLIPLFESRNSLDGSSGPRLVSYFLDTLVTSTCWRYLPRVYLVLAEERPRQPAR